MRERRLIVVGLIVPSILFGTAALGLMIKPTNDRSHERSRLQAAMAEPIVGDLLASVGDAQSRVTYPIPLLPAMSLTEPCTGSPTTLALQQVWASETTLPQSERQVALTYNMGLWISTTPKTWFEDVVANATDLPPVASVYDPDDFPDGLVNGSVRGHSAWVTELSPNFSCASAQGWAATAGGGGAGGVPVIPETSPTSSPPPTTQGPVHYDFSTVGHVVWMENEVVIDLTGPFSIAQLTQIATGITFP